MENRDADSYYAASRNRHETYPKLNESRDLDVCIIGGGMTGGAAALRLSEEGKSVAVLEARHVAWGAAGRSGGQMIVGYNKSHAWLAKHTTPEIARHLLDINLQGINDIIAICDKHDIQCDIKRGHYHVGLKPRHEAELEEMLREYHAMGLKDTQLFTGREVNEHVCSPLYTSALYDPLSGHLHPMNYTLGLMHAANSAGAEIYEYTPVRRIRTQNDTAFPYLVETQSGHRVRSRHVIMATNAYIDGLEPRAAKTIMPVGTYITATEPLGEQRCRELIANDSAVADVNFVLNYFRCSADHRMLFGGRATYSTITPKTIATTIEREMRRVFPQLSAAKIDYTWGGYVAITQNRLPHIGRLNDDRHLYFAQGYSGHGVILSTVCGRIVADAILGDDHALKSFEAIKHRAFFGGKFLRTPSLVLAMTYYKLRDFLP